MLSRGVQRSRLGAIEVFRIRLRRALVVTLALGVGVFGPIIPAARADVITLQDAYQELLTEPDQNDLDRALREVVTTSLATGNHGEAVTRLTALKDAHPNDIRIWFALAVSQLGDRRLTDALSSAEQSIRIRPDWPVAYWL